MYSIVIFTIEQLTAEHKGGEDREFLVWDGHSRLWNNRDKAQSRRLIGRSTVSKMQCSGRPGPRLWCLADHVVDVGFCNQRNGETLEDLEQRWSDSGYSIRTSVGQTEI